MKFFESVCCYKLKNIIRVEQRVGYLLMLEFRVGKMNYKLKYI